MIEYLENIIKAMLPEEFKRWIRICKLRKSPVLWANLGPCSKYLACSKKTLKPSILILSVPRSGSSWIGNSFAFSDTSLYLREPITQSYQMARKKKGPSFFEIESNNIPYRYKLAAERAFKGNPSFFNAIVKYPNQWTIKKRRNKRLVIKEVNPLCLSWFIEKYRPRIVYLIRHPAAVANSFNRLKWNGAQFEQRFTKTSLKTKYYDYKKFTHSFWAEFGALQAVIMNDCSKILKNYHDSIIIRYEDLCDNPINTIRMLYKFAELKWNEDIEELIEMQSKPKNYSREQTHSTYRDSKEMKYLWKRELSSSSINEVKNAFLYYNPLYYGSSEW